MFYKTQLVESYCPKCRFLSEHILPMSFNRPGSDQKVQCTLCKTEHKFYHDLLETSNEVNPKRRKKRSAETNSYHPTQKNFQAKEAWKETLAGEFNSKAKATIYNPQVTFEPGDLIFHTTFGLGIVIKVEELHRIKVLFEQGVKTLAQKLSSERTKKL
jgi:hypothetical protein